MYINVQAVRDFILDRSAQDNVLDMDLSFGEDEIKSAMLNTLAAFNGLPPYSITVTNPAKIPYRIYFLHGIIKHLYLSALAKIQRNRVEYAAGNMTSDPDAARAKYFAEAIAMHNQEFVEGARNHKIEVNLNAAYGVY